MQVIDRFMALLPRLRRFARALTGSQDAGDTLVEAALEQLINRKTAADPQGAEVAMFQSLIGLWESALGARLRSGAAAPSPSVIDGRLSAMDLRGRAAFLLVTLETFDAGQAARIMSVTDQQLEELLSDARRSIARDVATSILVIEDELFIALDLERIVLDLGHRLTGIARTRDEAVALAGSDQPGLVLADIHLADGSSGIDAVNDILRRFSVPVIFITAYPDRLLTGLRPEPTFLIPKPFRADDVRATISQTLFFRSIAGPAG